MESVAVAALPFSGAARILGSVLAVILPPPPLPPRQLTLVNAEVVRWIPPAPGWIKIHTDACVRGRTSGASSCGGVYRDFRGSVVKAFSVFLGHNMSALEAEMTAVIVAINSAYFNLGLRRVWLECDSLQTVILIKSMVIDDRIPESIKDQWRDVIQVMRRMDIRVSHIYREGNTVADKLANYAIETKVPICEFTMFVNMVDSFVSYVN